jgi:hypothetical protein
LLTQRKGTRISRPPAADNLRFSLLAGLKKTRLRLRQFLSLIPPTAVMLSVKEWDFKDYKAPIQRMFIN